jgi:hypothetical protein
MEEDGIDRVDEVASPAALAAADKLLAVSSDPTPLAVGSAQ